MTDECSIFALMTFPKSFTKTTTLELSVCMLIIMVVNIAEHFRVSKLNWLVIYNLFSSSSVTMGILFISSTFLTKLFQALEQGRIFMLDHLDYLFLFLSRINTNGVCAYASRTLLFLRSDGMLKPMAIELLLPGSSLRDQIPRVFIPAKQGIEAALWQLAKAHVLANDTVYHQLISHW